MKYQDEIEAQNDSIVEVIQELEVLKNICKVIKGEENSSTDAEWVESYIESYERSIEASKEVYQGGYGEIRDY